MKISESRVAEAFNRVKELAEQSAQRGDYYSGAVLLDKEGEILFEAKNDVATNEPHGIQAEAKILQNYFLEKRRGRDIPSIAECTLVTLCEPSVAAPQIVTAGIKECYYAIDDSFASLSRSELYPNGIADGVFRKLKQDQEIVREISDEVNSARERVLKEKQKYGVALPEVRSFSDEAKEVLGIIEGNSFSRTNFLAGDERQFADGYNLATFLSSPERLRSMQTANENVVLAFDKQGKLLAGFRDDCAVDPLNTAMMQAVDYFHETYRLAGGQGAVSEGERYLAVEGVREKVPHARDVVFLSLQEITLMEGARLSQPANKNCLFQEARPQGIITSNAISNLPALYKRKGLDASAVRSVSEEIATRKLEGILPATSSASNEASSLKQRERAAEYSRV